MRSVDPWPAAPVLRALPPVARLDMDFDVAPVLKELADVAPGTWSKILIMTGEGLGAPATQSDWRTIPLRSIGGAQSRTDPGGPDLEDFADTAWLDRLPSLREVIAALPQPVRSVRLMALGPGARSPLHSDTKWNLPWGVARLHVPLVTVPEATLSIGGEDHCWAAGQLWYADFTRGHTVQNTGAATRVHLVVDVEVSGELLGLLPPVFQRPEHVEGYLFSKPAVQLTMDPAELACRFEVPGAFLSWEELDGSFLEDTSSVEVSTAEVDGRLVLSVQGKPRFGLVHVGGDEFRWSGWTTERTIQLKLDDPQPHVVLRTRRGGEEWSLRTATAAVASGGGAQATTSSTAGI
ncbi:hypothetical protein ABH930_000488 [Kitasatospora sp. GAS204A]|uniref:aspartyl/asparaginyl beta-hydroxylase domain-containing protein n=1 Tax=unclassified Kitasatospora TaxID=2633591 RepID=UPI00247565B0|nr:aspartyl/asparaginyl beta-hydroxylase domain-containing protein [Kitasatospora sp. GAS204B]MDH6117069.1 hypothetical protein [Kitasatospora sp. GAS204B]